jgi:hypothetical protein
MHISNSSNSKRFKCRTNEIISLTVHVQLLFKISLLVFMNMIYD